MRLVIALVFGLFVFGLPDTTKTSNKQINDTQASQGESAYQIPDTLPVRVFPTKAGEREADETAKERNRKAHVDIWTIILTAVLGFFTLLIAIGTAYLAKFTYRLVRVTWVLTQTAKRQLASFVKAENRATDSTQSELRAYVFVNLVEEGNPLTKFGEEIAEGEQIKVSATLEYENFGKTPAYEVRRIIDMQLDDPKKPKSLPTIEQLLERKVGEGENRTGKTTLAMGKTVHGNCHYKFNTIKDYGTLFKGWEDGKIGIYIHGTVIYRDAFDKWWRSDFRYVFINLKSTGPSLWACEDGNEEKPYEPPPKTA